MWTRRVCSRRYAQFFKEVAVPLQHLCNGKPRKHSGSAKENGVPLGAPQVSLDHAHSFTARLLFYACGVVSVRGKRTCPLSCFKALGPFISLGAAYRDRSRKPPTP